MTYYIAGASAVVETTVMLIVLVGLDAVGNA